MTRSERRKRHHADPAFAAATAERMRQRWKNPEFRRKMHRALTRPSRSERMKTLNADPIFQAKRKAGIARKNRDDAYRRARDYLPIEAYEQIAGRLRAGECIFDVSNDFLISVSRARQIDRATGQPWRPR